MSAERFQFGEFEFDADTRVLSRLGRPVRLQAQPALLLAVLLSRSSQVVSREDLKQAVWGEDTFVDFERGLNFCMGQVRSVLRDDASRPVFIRTIPKQGYQFIAPVQRIAALPASQEAPRNSARKRWGSLAGAVALLVVLMVGAVVYMSGSNARRTPNVAVLRFDAETGRASAHDLAESLTDDVVVQLSSSSGGHYRIVGNAAILRTPRAQRDLGTIASTLHCNYAVLGQVQVDDSRILILAHLIRLSDLTHIEVVRIERKVDDSESLGAIESTAARQITKQFAAKMADHPESAASFPSAPH